MASSQIDTAYPSSTTGVHTGWWKPSVRGSAAVAPTSVAMASISRTRAIPMSSTPHHRFCSECYTQSVALATLSFNVERGGMSDRRQVLAEGATDYVLEHGLLDLSLRPLAAALGTSDRMLLYHFGDKLSLVATILRVSNGRSVQGIRDLAPSPDVRAAVIDLWGAVSSPQQARCQRLYVEAAALGVLGTEPFAS